MTDCDSNLLIGDEVFELKLGRFVDDLSAARVAVLVANLLEFLDDDVAQLFVAGEDRFVLGDLIALLLQFFQDFIDRELCEAIELELENRVDLLEGKATLFAGQALAIEVDDNVGSLAPGVQVFAGLYARVRCRE